MMRPGTGLNDGHAGRPMLEKLPSLPVPQDDRAFGINAMDLEDRLGEIESSHVNRQS